ncbi:MAG TPA: Ig-like domain-containing protein, partial [Vicinamibacterales bacterium]|nr:Ig-like domain-containing protein [Vicinamibacterales bacterium]
PASPPTAPSIRAIVLNPSRYLDQRVTISGQFSGRNLMGDLPDAPAKSRYDFVLRSSDASIWVVNMRPKGKDFDLALDSRIDTGRWLEVSGTIQERRGLQWLNAEAGSLTLSKPPAVTITADEPLVKPAAGPPPEVIFSAPTGDETEVSTGTSVRIQFSRDLDQTTLKNHVRVTYVDQGSDVGATSAGGAGANAASQAATSMPDFTTHYDAAIRVLVLQFAKPLEPLRMLKVELGEGIMGRDGQPLKPWTLTFGIGAS